MISHVLIFFLLGDLTFCYDRKYFEDPDDPKHTLHVPSIFMNEDDDDQFPNGNDHPKSFDRDYHTYYETINHVLVGSKTPVFISRVQRSLEEVKNMIVTYEIVENPFPDLKTSHKREKRETLSKKNDYHVNISADNVESSDDRNKPATSFEENYFYEKNADYHQPIKRHTSPWDKTFVEEENTKNDGPVIKKFRNLVYQSYFETCLTNSSKLQYIYDDSHLNHCSAEAVANAYEENHLKSDQTVYPKILVIVDYETFLVYKNNPQAVAAYVAAFFHGVDLRFREMKNPSVRLNIAGIIIPESSEAEPYLKYRCFEENLMYCDLAMSNIRKHFASRCPIEWCNYNILFFLTHRNMILDDPKHVSGCKLSGECYRNVPIVIVQDMGGFDGIITAAHELGHLFGAEGHEDQSGECDDEGYIMRANDKRSSTTRALHWSPCTLKKTQNFLKKAESSCFWSKPDIGKPYNKILPGKLRGRNSQCQLALGMRASEIERSNCIELWCSEIGGSTNKKIVSKSTLDPPAEGTSCGPSAICLNGDCVLDPEVEEATNKAHGFFYNFFLHHIVHFGL